VVVVVIILAHCLSQAVRRVARGFIIGRSMCVRRQFVLLGGSCECVWGHSEQFEGAKRN